MTHLSNDHIVKTYGGRLRLRVCGLFVQNGKLLLLRHYGLGEDYLLGPPGGGLELGETVSDALKREYVEESGVKVESAEFLFVHEHREAELHSVELFFEITQAGDAPPHQGDDPETHELGVALGPPTWLGEADLRAEKAANQHEMLLNYPKPADLLKCRGYYFRGKKIS